MTYHGIAVKAPTMVSVAPYTLGVVNNFSFGILELGV